MTASSSAASSGTKGDTPADLTDAREAFLALADDILGTSTAAAEVTASSEAETADEPHIPTEAELIEAGFKDVGPATQDDVPADAELWDATLASAEDLHAEAVAEDKPGAEPDTDPQETDAPDDVWDEKLNEGVDLEAVPEAVDEPVDDAYIPSEAEQLADAGLDALFALELDPKDFLRFLRTVEALADEAKLVVSHDRVSVRTVDPAHVAMVDASLKATGTTRGKRAKDVELGLDVESAVKRLKDLVKLDLPWQDVRPYLQTVDHSAMTNPRLPVISVPASVTIDRKAFETYLRVIGTVTDHVEVSVQAGGKALRLAAQGDVVKVAKELPAEVVSDDGAKSLFSLDYLENIVRAFKQASIKTLRLDLGTDFPVRFSGEDGALKATYLLAPRIEN